MVIEKNGFLVELRVVVAVGRVRLGNVRLHLDEEMSVCLTGGQSSASCQCSPKWWTGRFNFFG